MKLTLFTLIACCISSCTSSPGPTSKEVSLLDNADLSALPELETKVTPYLECKAVGKQLHHNGAIEFNGLTFFLTVYRTKANNWLGVAWQNIKISSKVVAGVQSDSMDWVEILPDNRTIHFGPKSLFSSMQVSLAKGENSTLILKSNDKFPQDKTLKFNCVSLFHRTK